MPQNKAWLPPPLNLATKLRNEKDYKGSLAGYLEAMELAKETGSDKIISIANANGTRVAYVLGNDYKKNESYEDALKAYEEGISLDSTFFSNYLGRAQALEELGRTVEALNGYIKAAEINASSEEDPEKTEKMYSKAENMVAIAWGDKKWDAVAEYAMAFLEVRETADVYFYLSSAMNAKGESAKALEQAEKAISLAGDGEADKYLMAKAESLESLGKKDEAIAAYKMISDAKYKERADYKIKELEGN